MAILTEPRRSVGACPNCIRDLRYDVLRSFHNVIRHYLCIKKCCSTPLKILLLSYRAGPNSAGRDVRFGSEGDLHSCSSNGLSGPFSA